jgi:hypothetical protein
MKREFKTKRRKNLFFSSFHCSLPFYISVVKIAEMSEIIVVETPR